MSTPQSNYRSPGEVPNEELISGYLDGELTAAEQATVERLLQEDASFRLLFEDLKSLRGKLQSLPQLEPSANLANTILARTELELRGTDGEGVGDLQPKSATVPATVPKVSGLNDLRRLLIAAVSVSAIVLLAFLFVNRTGDEVGPGVAQNPTPPTDDEGSVAAALENQNKPMDGKQAFDGNSQVEMQPNGLTADSADSMANNAAGGQGAGRPYQPRQPNAGPSSDAPGVGFGGGGGAGNLAPEDPAVSLANSTPSPEMKEAFQPRPLDVVSLDRQVFVVHLDRARFVKKLTEHKMKFTEQQKKKSAAKDAFGGAIRVETSMAQLRKLLSDEVTRSATNLFAYGNAERLASNGLQPKYRVTEDDSASNPRRRNSPQIVQRAASKADSNPLAPTSPAKSQGKAKRAAPPAANAIAEKAQKPLDKKSVEKSKELSANNRASRGVAKPRIPGGKLVESDSKKLKGREVNDSPRPSKQAFAGGDGPALRKSGNKVDRTKADGAKDTAKDTAIAKTRVRKALTQDIQKQARKGQAKIADSADAKNAKNEASRIRSGFGQRTFGGGGGGSFSQQATRDRLPLSLPRFSKRGEKLYMEAESRGDRGLSAADSSELMQLAQKLQMEEKEDQGGALAKATIRQQPNDRVVVLFVLREPGSKGQSPLVVPADSAKADAASRDKADAKAAQKPRK